MLTICIIESHSSEHFEECLDSLRKYTKSSYELKVFKEGDSREKTLNAILADLPGQDLVIVADDILFTAGWDDELAANWKENRIVGFSMLYPATPVIQNRGYRLVSIDGVVSSEALDKGRNKRDVSPFTYRACTTVTGCFQAIPANIARTITEFPLEGENRLGELLYHSIAISKGFEVGVLGHFLEHYGTSTKQNPDVKLKSESYLLERILWKQATEQFGLDELAEVKIRRELDPELASWLLAGGVIYGAGTITEFLGKKESLQAHILCSGLEEEEGMSLDEMVIRYKGNVDWSNVHKALITVEGKEEVIAKDIAMMAPHVEVFSVIIDKTESVHRYGIRKIDGT